MKIKNTILYSSSFIIFVLITYLAFLWLIDLRASITSILESRFSKSKFDNILVTKFPIPKISISNFSIDGKFAANNIDIIISPFSVLMLNPSIKEVGFTNSNYLMTEKNPIINHYEVISKLLSFNIADKIIFQGLTLSDSQAKQLKYLEQLIISKNSIFLQIDGINILNISRNLSNTSEKISISNKSSLYDFNLQEIYQDNILDSASGNINLDSQTQNSKPINIVFEINKSENSQNIDFKSDIISGSGRIAKISPERTSLSFNIEKIDLVVLQKVIDLNYLKKFLGFVNSLDFPLDLVVKIDGASLYQENFSNINLSASCDTNIINLANFSGIIDSGGEYKIKGSNNMINNEIIFQGDFSCKHSDIQTLFKNIGYSNLVTQKTTIDLNSKIIVKDSDLEFQGIECNLDQGTLSGDLVIKNINDYLNIDSNLNIANLSLSKYQFISDIYNYSTSLLENLSDSSYLTKYIPIRKINYNSNLNLSLQNVEFNGNNFTKGNLISEISTNKINIKQLYFNSDNQNINLSGSLDATSLIPFYEVSTNNSIINIGTNISDFLKDCGKIDISSLINQININGNINLDKLIIGGLEIDDLNLVFSNNDNYLLNIQKSTGKIANGLFSIEGNIVANPLKLSLVYGIDNFDVNSFLSIFAKQITGLSGTASSNGTLIINSDHSINIDSNFIAANIMTKNYSPDSFISEILSETYNVNDLDKDQNLIYQGASQISNVSGSYQIDGEILSSNIKFITKYSSGSVGVSINLSSNEINLENIINFYPDINYPNLKEQTAKITIDMKGNIDSLDKTINLSDLKKYLSMRR